MWAQEINVPNINRTDLCITLNFIFHVIEITFLIGHASMNRITNTFIPTYNLLWWNMHKLKYISHPNIFAMQYCHEWLENLDENHLVSDNNCNLWIYNAQLFFCKIFLTKRMTNDVGFTFSVGDTTRAVYKWARQNRVGATKHLILCTEQWGKRWTSNICPPHLAGCCTSDVLSWAASTSANGRKRKHQKP
jgi:hypothetical protein